MGLDAHRGRLMRSIRILFTLTLGGGPPQSSVRGRTWQAVRTLTWERYRELFGSATRMTFAHRWGDGWWANIEARPLQPRERAPKRDDFAGYGWMVDNIISYGQTDKPETTSA